MQCPSCYSVVNNEAFTCPYCNFNIEGYRQNINELKFKPLGKHADTKEIKDFLIRKHFKKERQDADKKGCLLILIGCLLFLIPIIGWLLGSIMIVIGFFSGSSMLPISLSIWIRKKLFKDNYDSMVSEATKSLNHTYTSLTCPNCEHNQIQKEGQFIYFLEKPENIVCDRCNFTFKLSRDFSYYLPNDESVPGKNVDKLIFKILKDEALKNVHSSG